MLCVFFKDFCRRIKEYLRFLKSFYINNFRLLKGMWKLTKLPQPAITIFGSATVKQENLYAKKAYELSKKLTEEGFSIITGGGPGIMAAANRGAFDAAKEFGLKNNHKDFKFTSLGITLTSFVKEHTNPYIQDIIVMDHFFSRKWLLVRYSIGFIVFPGGFGTMDELFEIITLEQCQRMQKMPIILINKKYWHPLVHWMKTRALKNKFIEEKDLELIYVTSDINEATEIILKFCKGKCKIENPLYTR